MKIKNILTVLCAFTLVGCGSLVGSNNMPDEMAVISGPPLTLPPNFELRPPQEQQASKAQAIRDESSGDDAKSILMGGEADSKEADTSWLLEQSGADAANPQIREMLEKSGKEE